MSCQNVGYAKTRASPGVYTDTYDDDGAVLHCFCFIILYDSRIS